MEQGNFSNASSKGISTMGSYVQLLILFSLDYARAVLSAIGSVHDGRMMVGLYGQRIHHSSHRMCIEREFQVAAYRVGRFHARHGFCCY